MEYFQKYQKLGNINQQNVPSQKLKKQISRYFTFKKVNKKIHQIFKCQFVM
ncbi:hypothetical protein TTHERM_000522099 (macronuclear) [Tetrahymena thermophila SB210]|uniref:Transmembrane protein n=1 Tax=Tetrahymena thermophila (strain SB210) TaxID=312017 RepID=W7XII4_TETTS|nr:hypothetical protein TTHERM_000522099 [Tetrahymena thermophila SB210]EWS74681.1 hypothetical protein TTHERM_000522099 [Tetrahymena thermophila SB210]|eukprot:XP_012652771.1 hypothetical protein TTHERM_000522099 [Tetrahymena thermophila SB210]